MMKKIIFISLILLIPQLAASQEWLGCDIPDPLEEVAEYAVIVDGAAEVIVPYQENTANDAVLIWDISSLTNAAFSVFAINSQGRRSVVATPFDLLAAPSGPVGPRIVRP